MKKIIALSSLIAIFLSGCGYALDVDEQSFVIAVGIDEGKEQRIRATFVFSNPIESGSGEDKKAESSSKGTDIVTIEAPSVYSAVHRLNAVKSKVINLTHTKLIVFSEKIARLGLKEHMTGFVSARDFRPNTYICISNCSADKYLRNVKPSQEAFIEKYFDHILRKVASDKVNESYLYYLYFNLSDNFSGSIVPLVGVNKNKLPKEKSDSSKKEDDFDFSKTAGKLIRKADNKSETLGSAALSGDKMVAKIGSFNTDIARIICNEYYPQDYSILKPGSDEYITVRLTQYSHAQIDSSVTKDSVKIDITLPILLKYIDPASLRNNPQEEKAFRKYLKKEFDKKAASFIKKTREKYKSDILGIGDSVKKHFLTIDEWNHFNWYEKYQSADIKVRFDIYAADYEEIN